MYKELRAIIAESHNIEYRYYLIVRDKDGKGYEKVEIEEKDLMNLRIQAVLAKKFRDPDLRVYIPDYIKKYLPDKVR